MVDEFDVKHLWVKEENWPELIKALQDAFGVSVDLEGFEAIMLSTEKHKDLDGMRIRNTKDIPK